MDDPCDLTHCLVTIDPRHQLDARANLSAVLVLPQIYSVTFFDYTPRPVVCEFDDVPVPDWFDEEAGVIEIPDDFLPPAADLRISAATIRYMPDGLMWHFHEKHGGAAYETATIPWRVVEQAVRKQR